MAHVYICLEQVVHANWMSMQEEKEANEGGHQDTNNYSKGVLELQQLRWERLCIQQLLLRFYTSQSTLGEWQRESHSWKLIKSPLEFIQRHVEDSKVHWKKGLCSDETNMELCGHQTRCYFWQTPKTAHHHKHTISTINQDGGSIVLSGCFSAAGPGRLVKVVAKIKAAKYRENLEENQFQTERELQRRRRFIF